MRKSKTSSTEIKTSDSRHPLKINFSIRHKKYKKNINNRKHQNFFEKKTNLRNRYRKQRIKKALRDKTIHFKLFEVISMANKTSGGVIVHFPTSKAQIISASQRLLHPLLPFPANTARPDMFSSKNNTYPHQNFIRINHFPRKIFIPNKDN